MKIANELAMVFINITWGNQISIYKNNKWMNIYTEKYVNI